MRKLILAALILLYNTATSQNIETQYPNVFTVSVTNPLSTKRENVLINVTPQMLSKASGKFNFKGFIVLDNGKEIPSQYNDNDKNNRGIVFVLPEIKAKETRNILVRFHPTASIAKAYEKRTQAELSHKVGGHWKEREYIGGEFKNVSKLNVPAEHKDHSWFIRYEGPGWESDKVAYRFYLDQRNAIDVFGKKTPDVVLQNVGVDGFDSYHNAQPWGMDIMKVGNSLGLGSIGAIVNGQVTRVEKTDSVSCEIMENGNVYSSILTKYAGWKLGDKKYDVQSYLSIHQGTRLTRHIIQMNPGIKDLCTGIGKDKTAQLSSNKGSKNQFGYIATYGKQSLNNDELGLVIFFDSKLYDSFTTDENSHIVKFKGNADSVEYYFAATWVNEPNGIKDEASFKKYIEGVAMELANPLKITIKN